MAGLTQLWRKKTAGSKNILGDNVGFWATFGPAFLIVSLSLALLKFASPLWPLLSFAAAGFVLCSKWKMRGLMIAVCGILSITVLHFPTSSLQEMLWWSGLSGSLTLGLFLTVLARAEMDHALMAHDQDIIALDEKIISLQHALKEAQLFAIQEKKEVCKELDAARQKLSESLEQAASCQKLLSLQQEKISDLEQAKAAEQNVEQTTVQLERNYRQLKVQFEEKSEALHQTRKELFQVEGQLIALQKECEQNLLDTSLEEVLFIEHLKEMDGECRDLEMELGGLQELVTELIGKKKTTRTRKSKKEVHEPDLNLTF